MVATKTQTLDKQQALRVCNNFFNQFKICCNQRQQPNADQFEAILSNNFQNTSNGRLLGKSIQDFLRRIQDLQRKYSHVEISNLQDCLVCGNKAALQFDLNLTLQSGEKRHLTAMAIATIDNDMITQWSQVSHDKDRERSHS